MKKKILLLCLSFALVTANLPAQNIGIGTTNPSRAKLEVHGAVDATAAIFGGDGAGISLQRNWPGIGFNSYYNNGHRYMANGHAALQFVDPNGGYMSFDMSESGNKGQLWTGYKRILTLFQSGNVAIGPDLSNSSLSVSRLPGFDATAYLYGTTHNSTFNFGADENTYIRAGKDNGTVFLNDIPNGKVIINGPVGINTATPVYPLEIRQQAVNNTIRCLALVEPLNFNYWHINVSTFSGGLDLYAGGTGGIFSASNGNYDNYSDRRLKTAIKPLAATLAKLIQLLPVKYEMIYNNPSHETSIGFIAQDVKPLFPVLVTTLTGNTSGYKNLTDVHTMNYRSLGVVNIKAIQEQQIIIESQQQALDELQKEYEELNKAVDELIKTAKSK